MVHIHVMRDEGIIMVEPSGPLQQSDFERLASEIDAFSRDRGPLVGLIIHTRSFPGWEDFGAFLHHMRFVKEHHKEIRRVALVTDSKLATIGPSLAKYFVSADIQHFEYQNLREAKLWVRGGT